MNSDTIESAPDGGFCYNQGFIKREKKSNYIYLKLYCCDYCFGDIKIIDGRYVEDYSNFKTEKYPLEIKNNTIFNDSVIYIKQ